MPTSCSISTGYSAVDYPLINPALVVQFARRNALKCKWAPRPVVQMVTPYGCPLPPPMEGNASHNVATVLGGLVCSLTHTVLLACISILP